MARTAEAKLANATQSANNQKDSFGKRMVAVIYSANANIWLPRNNNGDEACLHEPIHGLLNKQRNWKLLFCLFTFWRTVFTGRHATIVDDSVCSGALHLRRALCHRISLVDRS